MLNYDDSMQKMHFMKIKKFKILILIRLCNIFIFIKEDKKLS